MPSASAAELGPDAARITWRAAVEDSEEYFMLDDEEKREAFRRFVKGFGAWTEEEIASWSDIELNALFMQFVAGDVRESRINPQNPGWARYEQENDEGFQFFQVANDRVHYYLGA